MQTAIATLHSRYNNDAVQSETNGRIDEGEGFTGESWPFLRDPINILAFSLSLYTFSSGKLSIRPTAKTLILSARGISLGDPRG